MPFNGVGTFQRVYSWVTDAAAAILVDATRMDTDTDDIATGLSNCITRDGQSVPTANLPMATFKLTGLGAGAAPTDSVNYGQVFSSPTFVTPRASTTPTAGDSSKLLATTEFCASLAFSSSLPAISAATRGMYITNNGTVASWVTITPSFAAIGSAGGF